MIASDLGDASGRSEANRPMTAEPRDPVVFRTWNGRVCGRVGRKVMRSFACEQSLHVNGGISRSARQAEPSWHLRFSTGGSESKPLEIGDWST